MRLIHLKPNKMFNILPTSLNDTKLISKNFFRKVSNWQLINIGLGNDYVRINVDTITETTATTIYAPI